MTKRTPTGGGVVTGRMPSAGGSVGIMPELPWRNQVYGLRASQAWSPESGRRYANARKIQMHLPEVEARLADWTEEQEIPDDDYWAAYAAYTAGEWELAVEVACRSLGTAAIVRRELWQLMSQHVRTKLRKRQTELRSEQPGRHTKPTR